MGAAAYFLSAWLRDVVQGDSVYVRGARVFTAISAAILVLMGVSRVLRIEEFAVATSRVLKRLAPR